MIDWSSAPSTIVGSTVTIWPHVELTTRSTRMNTATRSRLTNIPASDDQRDMRLDRLGAFEDLGGLGLVDPDLAARRSNSSLAGRAERNNFMRRPGGEVLMLLVPEVAVDVAALDELGVAADVVDRAAFQHEDRVGRDQRSRAGARR